MTEALTRDEVAARAGAKPQQVEELVAAGILVPSGAGTFTIGDARRIVMILGILEAGLPLPAIGAAVSQGLLSLDFADSPVYRRFATLISETFAEASVRTGIPLEVLAVVRESSGWGPFEPAARLREDEAALLPWLEIQTRLGFRSAAIERMLRAMKDTLRRLAEAQGEWFRSEVSDPLIAQGRQNEITAVDPENHLSEEGERAMLALFHAQEAQTWTANMVDGFQKFMRTAGIHESADRPPAICFLDITGYTRLTQERGDHAAAELAETLATLVTRHSGAHGGRPVKWLGDGVMFHFRDAAGAVVAALEMVGGLADAGLPPAHVGIHAGPVIVQSGDYYGQTVNLAARIAEYARPGEVLVSEPVHTAIAGGEAAEVRFAEIGAVELKGVSGPVKLFSAAAH
jgi:adenylate cyclase